MSTTTPAPETFAPLATAFGTFGAALEPLLPLNAGRMESLRLATEAGADMATLTRIAGALRVARKSTIVLPRQRLENLSRGKGWARKGRGTTATWGERVDGGYEVGAGKWTVGGSDGFTRKGEDQWTVEEIKVGAETWTIAN